MTDAQRIQDRVSGLFSKRKKNGEKSAVATKLSFVAPIGSFLARLDTFSIARLLKITLVLLFLGEIHYLPSLRASLGRELAQRRFSLHPNQTISDAKKAIRQPTARKISLGHNVVVCRAP